MKARRVILIRCPTTLIPNTGSRRAGGAAVGSEDEKDVGVTGTGAFEAIVEAAEEGFDISDTDTDTGSDTGSDTAETVAEHGDGEVDEKGRVGTPELFDLSQPSQALLPSQSQSQSPSQAQMQGMTQHPPQHTQQRADGQCGPLPGTSHILASGGVQ